MDSLDYKITDISGIEVKLSIYAESASKDNLSFSEDAAEHGEASVQLREGCFYEYDIDAGYRLDELSGIVKNTRRKNSWGGRITPGIYVGTLPIDVYNEAGIKCGTFQLEVRSSKSEYREDYRYMLESITEYCTDLLMQHSSPVVQNFIQNYSADPETIYQRFAFIKSILDSEEFSDAVHRIISDPVTAWCEIEEETDIRKIRRPGGAGLRQIASGRNRIKIPENHYLKNILDDVPARISLSRKIETADTAENRFVKHALEVFSGFCSMVRSMLAGAGKESIRTYREALGLEEKLDQILTHSLFRQISKPSTLPLNSPVLQRKEGYREILRTWLMFDLAAKLVWHGGDDVYSAGKRDVAQLYEYWLFFKLLKILEEIFDIEHDSTDSLIEPTKDGLGLKLKSGISTPLKGVYNNPVRKLNVEFTYNRTFSGKRSYPDEGSWSRSLRPDYTLSLWPEGFEKDDAERQEIITHIHFDAKYRVESVIDIIGDEDINLDDEKTENRSGTYKRADLLKMHAYKDAIRRTGGAYVLYPGDDKTEPLKGFHEIIPGLGAFAVRPSREDDGSEHLKQFIMQVVEHFLNRASQHERMSYYTYDIHREDDSSKIEDPIPDSLSGKRTMPPADVQVLIGYYKDDQYDWIVQNNRYNVRIDTALTSEMAGARYLLLYDKETESTTGDLWEIEGDGPELWDREKMEQFNYPHEAREAYIVYRIKKCGTNEFRDYSWNVAELKTNMEKEDNYYWPFAVSLIELMKVKTDESR